MERRRARLTLKEAGERCGGVSHAYMSQIEHGRRVPSEAMIDAVCSWNGCERDWLVFGELAEVEPSRLDRAVELVLARLGTEAVEPVEGGELRAAIGEVLAAYQAPAPRHGDIAYVELADGRRLFGQVWIHGEMWVLVSVSPRPGEEPVVVPARQVARAFRWKGTLARD